MAWPPSDAFVASVGDLTLFGVDPVSMATFYVESIDGWDGTDHKVTTVPRAYDHGSYDPIVYYAERHLTLNVHVLGADLAGRRQGEARLKATLSGLSGTVLRVQEPPFDRYLTVWTNGPITTTKTGSASIMSVPLLATDPVRYSTTPSSVPLTLPSAGGTWGYPYGYPYGYGGGTSGSTIITNQGDVTVWPELWITGPVTNPVVENVTTGETLTLSLTLSSNDYLHIQGRDEIVSLNDNASRRSAVAAGSLFPTLPAGDSLWQFRASTFTAAALTVAYNDGWA